MADIDHVIVRKQKQIETLQEEIRFLKQASTIQLCLAQSLARISPDVS